MVNFRQTGKRFNSTLVEKVKQKVADRKNRRTTAVPTTLATVPVTPSVPNTVSPPASATTLSVTQVPTTFTQAGTTITQQSTTATQAPTTVTQATTKVTQAATTVTQVPTTATQSSATVTQAPTTVTTTSASSLADIARAKSDLAFKNLFAALAAAKTKAERDLIIANVKIAMLDIFSTLNLEIGSSDPTQTDSKG